MIPVIYTVYIFMIRSFEEHIINNKEHITFINFNVTHGLIRLSLLQIAY